MGYSVKIQKVERGSTKSFYVNFPAAIAEACNIEKGEEMFWAIEDKNSFTLQRVNKQPIKKSKESTEIPVLKKKKRDK
jgi:hypothetical protein